MSTDTSCKPASAGQQPGRSGRRACPVVRHAWLRHGWKFACSCCAVAATAAKAAAKAAPCAPLNTLHAGDRALSFSQPASFPLHYPSRIALVGLCAVAAVLLMDTANTYLYFSEWGVLPCPSVECMPAPRSTRLRSHALPYMPCLHATPYPTLLACHVVLPLLACLLAVADHAVSPACAGHTSCRHRLTSPPPSLSIPLSELCFPLPIRDYVPGLLGTMGRPHQQTSLPALPAPASHSADDVPGLSGTMAARTKTTVAGAIVSAAADLLLMLLIGAPVARLAAGPGMLCVSLAWEVWYGATLCRQGLSHGG